MWKCKLCYSSDCYFGGTTQKCHIRTNGHRGCFHDEEKIENSALSMHAKEAHGGNFNLENFQISMIKSISPQNIRREEFRYIEKYRTIQLGLNRYKASICRKYYSGCRRSIHRTGFLWFHCLPTTNNGHITDIN